MKKIFLNESERLKLISEKEKMIIESFAKTYNKIKRIDENEITSQPNILFPDWLIKKLNDVHTKVGQGSIFAMDVNKVVEIAKQVVAKEKNIEKIANSTGTISTTVNNVGYDLVLPMENAKKLPNAQITKTNKVEGPTTMEVPAVKTSAPLQSFKTNQLTIIVRPMKNDAGEVVPNGYIILSVFPGNPNIPRISEWNGKYAVIIPNQKSSMNEQRYLIDDSIIVENFINSYKLLLELNFHDSPDEDLPGGKRTIIFNRNDKYPASQGNTHGLLSHAIKHYIEFQPEYVNGLLEKIANIIRQEGSELYMVDNSGNVVLDGDKAKKEINHNVVLNTLDMIQDKVKNAKPLSEIEKKIYAYIEEMGKKYQELVTQKMNSAVDIDTNQNAADDAIKHNKTVKFKGNYSGKDFDYYLDPKDSSLVASDGDSVSTLFRIDKKGNSLDKMSGYFSRGTKIYNNKLKAALNLN